MDLAFIYACCSDVMQVLGSLLARMISMRIVRQLNLVANSCEGELRGYEVTEGA